MPTNPPDLEDVDELPPVVLLPVDQPVDGSPSLLLEQVQDVRALAVYSGTEALVRLRGPDQHWVAVETSSLEDLMGHFGADVVLLDTAFEPA